MSQRTLWLGRARARAGATFAEKAVRVWTDGAAPSDDDRVEEILDPFAACQRHFGARADADVAAVARSCDKMEGGLCAAVAEVELAPPVRPGKIVCVGRNYREHAAELGNVVPDEPLLFYKPASALVATGDAIELPPGFERIDMESELVVVMGRHGRRLSRDNANDVVVGYTLGNDVSCRDLQNKDKQWTRAKGFDTFCPLGPWVRVPNPGAVVPEGARIQGFLDAELRQDAPIADMVFDIPTVLAYVSEYISLEPGDVVYTGTPRGVNPLSPGQTVKIQLAGWDLGTLVNSVVAR